MRDRQRLVLARESLTELHSDELVAVVGGVTVGCTSGATDTVTATATRTATATITSPVTIQ